MNYNSDVAHCSGYLCTLHEKCRRFQLFIEWKKRLGKGEKILAPFIATEYDSGQCRNFIKIE